MTGLKVDWLFSQVKEMLLCSVSALSLFHYFFHTSFQKDWCCIDSCMNNSILAWFQKEKYRTSNGLCHWNNVYFLRNNQQLEWMAFKLSKKESLDLFHFFEVLFFALRSIAASCVTSLEERVTSDLQHQTSWLFYQRHPWDWQWEESNNLLKEPKSRK